MLDTVLMDQLRALFKDLNAQYTFGVEVAPEHPKREELLEILNDITACSTRISCKVEAGEGLQFTILKDGVSTRIKFRCTPNGHEFSSLILAILNCDGKGKNRPDEETVKRVRALKGPIKLVTYVNLSCLACSEVVQSLNMLTTLSDQISHEIVDGGINKLEVVRKNLPGIPAVFADEECILIGRSDHIDILEKLEAKYGNS